MLTWDVEYYDKFVCPPGVIDLLLLLGIDAIIGG